jgi:hypothetical protein
MGENDGLMLWKKDNIWSSRQGRPSADETENRKRQVRVVTAFQA